MTLLSVIRVLLKNVPKIINASREKERQKKVASDKIFTYERLEYSATP